MLRNELGEHEGHTLLLEARYQALRKELTAIEKATVECASLLVAPSVDAMRKSPPLEGSGVDEAAIMRDLRGELEELKTRCAAIDAAHDALVALDEAEELQADEEERLLEQRIFDAANTVVAKIRARDRVLSSQLAGLVIESPAWTEGSHMAGSPERNRINELLLTVEDRFLNMAVRKSTT